MKSVYAFLTFIAISAFIISGCGQNNPPRNPAVNVPSSQPQIETPNSNVSTNAGSTDNSVASPDTRDTKNTSPIPSTQSVAVIPPPVTPGFVPAPVSDADAYHQNVLDTIKTQEDILAKEQSKFDKAIREKTKDVHFTKDLLISITSGLFSGALTWDFLHRTGVVEKGPTTYYNRYVPKKLGGAGEGRLESAAVSEAETASLLSRITSGVSALVFGYVAIRYAIQAQRDYAIIHFSSDQEVIQGSKNIAETRKNLAEARHNLRIYWDKGGLQN